MLRPTASSNGEGEVPRRMLLKGAAVGTVAWSAPLLRSTSAYAQGSPGVGSTTTTTTSTTLPPSPPALLGTHTAAASQSTSWGQRLQEMAIYDGIVFVGYGDWNANTGPIQAGGWDISPPGMVYEAALDTENTWVHRVVNGRLVVPFTDPQTNTGDLAYRAAGSSTWTTLPIDTVPPIGAGSIHCFDAATFDGTDLWVCGARIGSPDAVVWRSPSGNGGDWVEMLSYTPPVKPPPINFARFNTLVLYNGLLYVGGYYFFDNITPLVVIPGQAWDGNSWIPAPEYTLYSGVHRPGHRPLPFDGQVVRLYAWPTAAYPMLFFDGSTITVGATAYHHNVDDQGRLWWIDSAGDIYRQDPGGGSPTFVVAGPAGASCLAVQGTGLYIGTASSQIWHVANV